MSSPPESCPVPRLQTPLQDPISLPWQQPQSNVPLLPRDVLNRQNSLPSYDDVMRMPSAPPQQ